MKEKNICIVTKDNLHGHAVLSSDEERRLLGLLERYSCGKVHYYDNLTDRMITTIFRLADKLSEETKHIGDWA